MELGSSGQLNVTLLFGFSSGMSFPATYEEFKRVVELAKSLEHDLAEPGVKKRKVTITVGAAVPPHLAPTHFRELDVGQQRGRRACALRRLINYAAQPDSGVDIVRTGMEDTPYLVDAYGQVRMTDNVELLSMAIDELRANGADIEYDDKVVFECMATDSVRDNMPKMEPCSALRQDSDDSWVEP
ncbi:hypothetical protein CRH09_30800 [Nocardia terpenica]|uniref:Uncharacterized protein n=2 Tax=Nocardia terpenica TaxID=455432 RepID=A0A291RR11_9NOCA|nr:hypothetical protein CRH09_30800 [Nocardia terpenica]